MCINYKCILFTRPNISVVRDLRIRIITYRGIGYPFSIADLIQLAYVNIQSIGTDTPVSLCVRFDLLYCGGRRKWEVLTTVLVVLGR